MYSKPEYGILTKLLLHPKRPFVKKKIVAIRNIEVGKTDKKGIINS